MLACRGVVVVIKPFRFRGSPSDMIVLDQGAECTVLGQEYCQAIEEIEKRGRRGNERTGSRSYSSLGGVGSKEITPKHPSDGRTHSAGGQTRGKTAAIHPSQKNPSKERDRCFSCVEYSRDWCRFGRIHPARLVRAGFATAWWVGLESDGRDRNARERLGGIQSPQKRGT